MATPPAQTSALATQARRAYVDFLLQGVGPVVTNVTEGARSLANQAADPETSQKRRNLAMDLPKSCTRWQNAMVTALRSASFSLGSGGPVTLEVAGAGRTAAKSGEFSLVDDDTIEREILSSRLALAMMDKASWEFTDLRSRISVLEQREEMDAHDVLRPHVLASFVIDAWRAATLDLDAWRTLQPLLHDEFTHFVEEAYHECNRWLLDHGVRPEIDLRPFIKRTGSALPSGPSSGPAPLGGASASAGLPGQAVGEETRLMTRTSGLPAHGSQHAEAVLGRLNRLIGRQVPEFSSSTIMQPSPALKAAISEAQHTLTQHLSAPSARGRDRGTAPPVISTPALLQELQQRKQALKQAASTPVERATIEIVALLFQSILTEERIPAAVRVWFARLQMPVLRVAVSEPDFFATIDHPARKLIDRMGACVMGFDATTRAVGDALEKEIKRVVQVVEAYPDT
ncbi:MAG TPA: DUF1631 family protein, partial [Methylibium sp.]